MMNLIEEATQREQERFEAREKAIISESEEKLQKKEETIANLKKEIESLSEEKDFAVAEKMYVESYNKERELFVVLNLSINIK